MFLHTRSYKFRRSIMTFVGFTSNKPQNNLYVRYIMKHLQSISISKVTMTFSTCRILFFQLHILVSNFFFDVYRLLVKFSQY